MINTRQILQHRMVAVLRAEDPAEVLAVAEASTRAGLDVLEVTFTVPDAPQLIQQLRRDLPHACIGAGTVVSPEQTEVALAAGAEFVVSPALRPQVIDLAERAGVLAVPGILTPTELIAATDLGCDLVKLFPASIAGFSGLRALRSISPGTAIMPTGGVDESNAAQWWAAGAAAVGLGSSLHAAYARGGAAAIAEALAPLIMATRPGSAR